MGGKAGSENPIVDPQSKAQCKSFHVSISFTCMRIQKTLLSYLSQCNAPPCCLYDLPVP